MGNAIFFIHFVFFSFYFFNLVSILSDVKTQFLTRICFKILFMVSVIEMDEETIRDQIGELEERYGACALEELPDYYEEDPLITRPSKEEIVNWYNYTHKHQCAFCREVNPTLSASHVTGKSSKNNKKFTTLPYMWCHLFSQY
jgi:hypothetical protein